MYNFVKLRLEDGHITWFEIGHKFVENCLGGRMEFDPLRHQALAIVRAESMIELDWSGTSFDDPNAKDGWLTPDGKFHGCSFGSHDIAAKYMLKKSPMELRKLGYGKVYAKNVFDGKPFVVFEGEPTEVQTQWMKERGIE